MISCLGKCLLFFIIWVMIFVVFVIGFSFFGIGYLVNSVVEYYFVEQDVDELEVMIRVVDCVLCKMSDGFLCLDEVLLYVVLGYYGVYFQVWDKE